jgi:acyl-CoA thioesterase-1
MKRLVGIGLIMLLAGRAALAAESGRTILLLGDSIGAGYGVPAEASFAALLQRRLEFGHPGWKIVNVSVSGDTTAGGLRRVDWVLKRPADILLIELGGNDGLRGVQPEETLRNLEGIIDRARRRRPGIRIILAGMQMPANMGETYTSAFRAVFPAVARSRSVNLIPFLLEGVGAKPEFNQPDLIHPNAAGHRRVAENVWPILAKVLATAQSAASE